jgi:hypothetical protein
MRGKTYVDGRLRNMQKRMCGKGDGARGSVKQVRRRDKLGSRWKSSQRGSPQPFFSITFPAHAQRNDLRRRSGIYPKSL